MPYIDSKDNKLKDFLMSTFYDTSSGLDARKILVTPWPKQVLEGGALEFNETIGIVKPDILVFATGYSQRSPFLDPSYPLPQHAKVRGIWKKDEPMVGFIGFVRPTFGELEAYSLIPWK